MTTRTREMVARINEDLEDIKRRIGTLESETKIVKQEPSSSPWDCPGEASIYVRDVVLFILKHLGYVVKFCTGAADRPHRVDIVPMPTLPDDK